jgi:cephalosporin hydroxylase
MDPVAEFFAERKNDIDAMGADTELRAKSIDWMVRADKYKYTYNFTWMGRPIIKFPNDMVAQQEIVWRTKPDLIIETGIAHGGSIIFSASLLELLGHGQVVGVDIDIRKHNREAIEAHPMSKRIKMFEGSSTAPEIFEQISELAKNAMSVLVILDSNHTHEHVYKELNLYADLVTVGNYVILPDTFIEFFPKGYYASNRPWDVGNNPWTAMRQFMSERSDFELDHEPVSKCMITESFDGYLRRTKNGRLS